MAQSGTREPGPVVGLAFGSALLADALGRIVAEHGVVCLPDEGLAPPGSTTSVVVARGDQRGTGEVADVDSLINLVVELATSR